VNRNTVNYRGVFVPVIFILLVIVFLLYSFYPRMDVQGATETLQMQGYTEITITDWRWFAGGCSKDDWYHTGFKAIAPTGQSVTGVVCGGKFINTIHLD